MSFLPKFHLHPANGWDPRLGCVRAVTAAEMKRIDALVVERYGLPALLLMEHAGRAVAEAACDLLRRRGTVVCVLAGSGHNGGDGIVAARWLKGWGCRAKVLWLKDPALLEGDTGLHYRIARRFGVPFEPYAEIPLFSRLRRLRLQRIRPGRLPRSGPAPSFTHPQALPPHLARSHAVTHRRTV